ncbi:MAG: DUF2235 domain-containing protein [Burkholderiaceae bacterium]
MSPTPMPAPKVLVVFSDGTGNSAAKLQKTNVWRLYRALDLAAPTPQQTAAGEAAQFALYDGGVGASEFRPLALLGGVFGYGLKRNVLDLYKFLCRNYRPGDRIYAFGFSRGAFTIRVLMGFVLRVGLLECNDEASLHRDAPIAYRKYRRHFKARNLAGVFRWLRDKAFDFWGRLVTLRVAPGYVHVDAIEFVGVWDTVAAYGMPIVEMTRGVDQWIWPTSMPNYVLSSRVKQARHALALDDERDTFHPLLWDEAAEAPPGDAPPRLQQVWFAGMHSDIGGGYPDDSLAHVALDWMMDEAQRCGLRFKPGAREQVTLEMNALGPLHDSRSSLGMYYRYQPRRLGGLIEPPDPATLAMQDPDRARAHGRLRDVLVHPSVLQRIRSNAGGYAPIALAPRFSVWNPSGEPHAVVDVAADLDAVWNDVWRRRVAYFASVMSTLALFALVWLPESTCQGFGCLLSRAIVALGKFAPDMALPVVRAWAANPGVFATLVFVLLLARYWSGALQRSIDDQMSVRWRASLGRAAALPSVAAADESPAGTPSPAQVRRSDAVIARLRKAWLYQKALQWLKWRVAPAAFAALLLFIAGAAVFVLFSLAF